MGDSTCVLSEYLEHLEHCREQLAAICEIVRPVYPEKPTMAVERVIQKRDAEIHQLKAHMTDMDESGGGALSAIMKIRGMVGAKPDETTVDAVERELGQQSRMIERLRSQLFAERERLARRGVG